MSLPVSVGGTPRKSECLLSQAMLVQSLRACAHTHVCVSPDGGMTLLPHLLGGCSLLTPMFVVSSLFDVGLWLIDFLLSSFALVFVAITAMFSFLQLIVFEMTLLRFGHL